MKYSPYISNYAIISICTPTGVYYAPDADTIQVYRDYVEGLPFNDQPEIFGMHENANIAFQVSSTYCHC